MDTVGDLTPADHECDVISGENKSGINPDEDLDIEGASDFTEKTWKEDFAFIVENKKLYVTKAVLALVSPMFDKMFQSDFKEKQMSELELPGKKFDDVQEFLRCVYPGMEADVYNGNVQKVLPLADEYQVSGLKSKCEQVLCDSLYSISNDELFDVLVLAETYSMENLLRNCVTEISTKPVQNLDRGLKRKSVSVETQCEIKDKMVRRLEQSEREKKWYESAYKILLHGANKTEKLAIKERFGWTGRSLQFSPTVGEIQRSTPLQHRPFTLFNIAVMFHVHCSCNSVYLKFKYNENKLKGWKISIYGRLLIKCGTTKNDDFNSTFQTSFTDGSSDQSVRIYGNTVNASFLLDETAGFIHYGKMDAEIHLLANREEYET